MQLRAGEKLRSVVCDAQVVVVKAPDGDVELACGGAPMAVEGGGEPSSATLDETLGDGPAIGKRYADDALGLELLCVRAGKGALTVGGEVLGLKSAKALPASD